MRSPVFDVRLDERAAAEALRADVRVGLTDVPRWISPTWLYDSRGSELFDEITQLPEYYPTRAERAVLRRAAPEIAVSARANTLVELGSGSADKTRLLLDAMTALGDLRRYVPVDISMSALRQSSTEIAADYPELDVHGVLGDFTRELGPLPAEGSRLVAFLGGTVGNLDPDQRRLFYRTVRSHLRTGEWLLVGADLVKDPATLLRAYDDPAGVTAEFDRNVLRVLNRELDGDFDVDAFEHVARWDPQEEWIEMRLRARRPLRVRLGALDLTLDLAGGEEIRTEISAKFRPERVRSELADVGFAVNAEWTDPEHGFTVFLAAAT
ncbi:L-histidine N(alpha)-methyltransferase [Actinoalloteichus sp. AHMU CJ021]|uniref:Histidine N-alpha-methyltransferase n=1 Tax=Actinoalloteichus caeruleus DSM 43889 TaxID=1120930 RepID=A0ABT1JBR9_ACTCY|nr:L-histidine N(alpha)-methyltransferase [Actinoalloteichus caeruleus]AUS80571.1 L-histidine N(alpha)-methyltransferase [Actinoalloteichus sp. AHMU CJ021]MCP2329946.1 L-histidine Nalpha-methyltransferase [Actinoalloteichus caeruleus DSM 43889]